VQRSDVLNLSRMTQIDRDPDWVFSQLHDPEKLLNCVPGGSLTRVIDAERFEARVVIAAGPFKLACNGDGRIVDSDPQARTASLRLDGLAVRHMPRVRVRMSMAVQEGHPHGSEVQMSFRLTVVDRSGLLNRGWVDLIASDLLEKTVHQIKTQLESTTGRRPA
jgi:carbon monoxide dehydrogenase subunit G